MIEGKTKKITKLDPSTSGKMWSAKVPPYPHLVNIETKDRLTANDAAEADPDSKLGLLGCASADHHADVTRHSLQSSAGTQRPSNGQNFSPELLSQVASLGTTHLCCSRATTPYPGQSESQSEAPIQLSVEVQ